MCNNCLVIEKHQTHTCRFSEGNQVVTTRPLDL